ncbi:MAG: diphosphomevalonate decarboxylase [Anaerolineaceae bacterium]|nr:diphosphomevalonate decarboxylase [Anaerolineaceae bacterium]
MMNHEGSATARAHSNIALIKYWGNQDERLRLPANPSLSFNLAGLFTEVTVNWGADADSLTINGEQASPKATARVSSHLSALRQRLGFQGMAEVVSETNIPLGAGVASSAAAFAALTLAASTAAGFECDEATLSALARLGSGSAARSVPTGFVSSPAADTHAACHARSIAPPNHWALADVIALIETAPKKVSSLAGHRSAKTSPLQSARIKSAAERYRQCERAILTRDFDALAAVVELDSNAMHAVMMTSRPPLMYWHPASITVMNTVTEWRRSGIPVCYTLDAGPNVHCICPQEVASTIREGLRNIPGVVETMTAFVGKGAHVILDHAIS